MSSPNPRLPSRPDKFVGRERELRRLRESFETGQTRLLSILGPPGMGKTRLALRYLEELSRAEPKASSWFIDLSSAHTTEELCAAVAAALGVGLAGSAELELAIAHALEARGPALLVLDNFEQLVTAGVPTLATWITLAPEARFLVTSRELLRISGESWFELEPLALPAPGDLTPEQLRGTSALELLLERAPSIALSSENAQALTEISIALEGIPLAIELCAARMSTLGVNGVLSRLHAQLDLMNHGARSAVPRQQTLRGAIDWSWHSLAADERLALGACAVFAQGFSVEAFEAVCADLPGRPALDRLQSLREKSLLRSLPGASRDGEIRLGMYDSIRAYVAERLAESPQFSELKRSHARYFAELGELQAKDAEGARAKAARGWLHRESENLRAAYEWLGERAEGLKLRARLVLALEPILSRRGPLDRYRAMLDEVNQALSANEPSDLAVRVARARARALRQRGLLGESALELNRAEQLCHACGSPELLAELAVDHGELEQERGQFTEARRRYDQALACLSPAPRAHARARAHAGLGLLSHSQGKLDEALACYERAMSDALHSGDLGLEAGLSKDIGSLRLQQGRLAEARELYGHALELLETLDDPILSGVIEANLAILAQEQGEFAEAERRFGSAEHKLSRAGARLLEAHVRGYRGTLHHELGELDAAALAYARALRVVREVGDVRLEGLFSATLGSVESMRGRSAAAREAFAIAAARLDEVSDPGLLEALALHRAFLTLATASDGDRPSDWGASESGRAGVIELARRTRARSAQGLLAHSDDARFALRLLERELRRNTWIFELERSAIVSPEGTLIDLGARPQLLRIARALAEQRVTQPGIALTQDALLACAWPGEKMSADAASNRMKVALSTLRTLGLRSLIQRTEHGYLLDPSSPVLLQSD